MKLLAIHVQHGAIDEEQGDVVKGALNYKEMTVGEVMTPLEDVFMLSKNARLDFKTIREIFQQGFSRIPVYGTSRDDILGLLLVKDLIFIDPEDAAPVDNFIKVFGRGMQTVWEHQFLDEVLKAGKKLRRPTASRDTVPPLPRLRPADRSSIAGGLISWRRIRTTLSNSKSAPPEINI